MRFWARSRIMNTSVVFPKCSGRCTVLPFFSFTFARHSINAASGRKRYMPESMISFSYIRHVSSRRENAKHPFVNVFSRLYASLNIYLKLIVGRYKRI